MYTEEGILVLHSQRLRFVGAMLCLLMAKSGQAVRLPSCPLGCVTGNACDTPGVVCCESSPPSCPFLEDLLQNGTFQNPRAPGGSCPQTQHQAVTWAYDASSPVMTATLPGYSLITYCRTDAACGTSCKPWHCQADSDCRAPRNQCIQGICQHLDS